jgi:hypothetical protein
MNSESKSFCKNGKVHIESGGQTEGVVENTIYFLAEANI